MPSLREAPEHAYVGGEARLWSDNQGAEEDVGNGSRKEAGETEISSGQEVPGADVQGSGVV